MLTVGKQAIGGVLDGGEGGICLEEVNDDLRTFHLQIVAAQTANSGQNGVSAGADEQGRESSAVHLILQRGCRH